MVRFPFSSHCRLLHLKLRFSAIVILSVAKNLSPSEEIFRRARNDMKTQFMTVARIFQFYSEPAGLYWRFCKTALQAVLPINRFAKSFYRKFGKL